MVFFFWFFFLLYSNIAMHSAIVFDLRLVNLPHYQVTFVPSIFNRLIRFQYNTILHVTIAYK